MEKQKMKKADIERVLKERPDIERLIDLIMEYPEEQRGRIARIITILLKLLQEKGFKTHEKAL